MQKDNLYNKYRSLSWLDVDIALICIYPNRLSSPLTTLQVYCEVGFEGAKISDMETKNENKSQ